MSRGVAYPQMASVVVYIDIADIETDLEYQDFKLNIEQNLINKIPSLFKVNKWLSTECHVILENSLVYIGVSTYGHILTLWIVPKDTYENLSGKFITRIAPHVKAYATHVAMGTMSNGETVYRKVRQNE